MPVKGQGPNGDGDGARFAVTEKYGGCVGTQNVTGRELELR